MAISAAEQYALELINRARLDPAGEAARMGIPLNQGLPSGSFGPISTTPKQVLAFNTALDTSATRHTNWMVDSGNFSHYGPNGISPFDRMRDAGYNLNSGGWSAGENLAMASGSGMSATQATMALHHRTLFNSAMHRANMFADSYREVGIAESSNGRQSVETQNFASRSEHRFVTGVAYTDRNDNNFYDIGEGVGSLKMSLAGTSAAMSTDSPGGYALRSTLTGNVTVQVGTTTKVQMSLAGGNVKLDVVDGNKLMASGSMTLVSGIATAELLGIQGHSLTGHGGNNTLLGNAASNRLSGMAGDDVLEGRNGNDSLFGGIGNDKLVGGTGRDSLKGEDGNDRIFGDDSDDFIFGGTGNDLLSGGAGNDLLFGELGNDTLSGGAGNDRLNGGGGVDVLTGASGADSFVMLNGNGADRATDFHLGEGDTLALDDALWSGTLSAAEVVSRHARVVSGAVVFDFGGGDVLTLAGISSTAGLAGVIDII